MNEVTEKLAAEAAQNTAQGNAMGALNTQSLYDPAEAERREARYERERVNKAKLDVFGAILHSRPNLSPAEAATEAAKAYAALCGDE